MKIAGVQPISMVDYPGKLAAVVFCAGCNLNCHYCHNRWLLNEAGVRDVRDPGEVLALLARRRGLLDGVVVSGGEATLQPDLERFLLDVRDLGYSVKLDTNGTRPDVLEALVRARLVDYVAMDLKAPREKYGAVCACQVDLAAIERSVEILLAGRVEYEFRTTMAPELTREDLLGMAGWIRGARAYALQQYRPVSAEWFGEDERLSPEPREAEEILEWARELHGFVGTLETRGLTIPTIGNHPRAAVPRRRAAAQALPAATA